MVLHECPFCHKLFAAQPVSKEQVGSDEVTKWIDVDPIKREHYRRGMFGNLGVVTEPGVRFERIADHPEDFITYKLTYRCKDCGKEWSKFSVKEVDIPKQYVEAEEEKTDYDAEKEEEYAREYEEETGGK